VPAPPPAAPRGIARVSPAARKLAAERGIALAGIAGTGPGGAVISADVERSAAGGARAEAAPAKRHGLDLAEMRKAIAAAMARSKREIPHYYLGHAIDMSAALDWLAAVNAKREPPERLLLAALLLKAVALALEQFPEFNGFYTDGAFRPSESIHLGTAIAIRGGGLVAPAIRDADEKTLDELMAALRDLVARTRAGRLRGSELFDPTITVSSLGERGVESLYGAIYPPQVAIVGFGTPTAQPRAVDGHVEVRTVTTVTLAADHRASDGHRGALLLLEIERLLQHPEAL
jgi:pyruvate dehydrogenase E2 component (dihydrolipoamide acetyltransferase)